MERIFATDWESASRVLVHIGTWNGGALSCEGTGVLLDAEHVVTAKHVVDPCLDKGPLAVMAAEYPRVNQAHLPLNWSRADVHGSFENRDVYVLKCQQAINSTGRVSYTPAAATLAAALPGVGEAVDNYGHPPALVSNSTTGLTIVFAGIVHVRRYVAEVTDETLLCTMPVQPGMSGGPLFNDAGELIAIARATHVPAESIQGTSAIWGWSHFTPLPPLKIGC